MTLVAPGRCLLAALALLTAAAFAYTTNPPNANTGRPGEVTCANCHEGLTASAESTQLSGLPSGGYRPESTYRLTLAVRYRGMRRWGFEVTAADSANRPAGRFIITDSVRTQYGTSRGFGYVKQTGAGAHKGRADSCSWKFAWRAPDSVIGPVTFYWDVLPCNNDGGPYGDVDIPGNLTLVPWSSRTLVPRRYTWHYANPESSRAIIIYRGNTERPLRLFAADGRLVGECRGAMTETAAIADWNGTDPTGVPVPAGDYFVELGTAVDTVIAVEFVPRKK